MTAIEAFAPNRVDLAGGTLDLYPLYLFEDYGITVNAAVTLGSTVRLETREDARIVINSLDTGASLEASDLDSLPLGGELDLLARIVRFYDAPTGLTVTTRNLAPKGSGLGSSSSLLIALSGALCRLNGKRVRGDQLVDYGAQLEAQNLGVPTGKQDYYAAVRGGVNAIWFRVGGNQAERLLADEPSIRSLEERMVLTFTGEPRFSGATNWSMMKAYIDGDEISRTSMKAIKDTALAMREAVMARDWDGIGRLLGQEWENRRRLAEGVSTAAIEAMMSAAAQAGAVASKVCGAGGGGCMITWVSPERRRPVETALSEAGAQVLPLRIARKGLVMRGFQQ